MTPEQAAQKYHWCSFDKDTNTLCLFLDHHVLSSFRLCEANGYLNHIVQVSPYYGMEVKTEIDDLGNRLPVVQPDSEKPGEYKPVYVAKRKPWFLDFGEYLHFMLEVYYKSFIHREDFQPFNYIFGESQQCLNLDEFLKIGKKAWLYMDMDYYKDKDDKYTEIGGWPGVSSLLTQYYSYYMGLRMRVVSTEIIFGKKKEVKLGEFWSTTDLKVECYLTGRIDLLVDNGSFIGPVDHKHTHKFRGDEQYKFNPQDAITGYILACNAILHEVYPKYFESGKNALNGWIFHISGCTPSKSRKTGEMGPRFKHTPIGKTEQQLEEFKARQLSTFKRVCELMFDNKTPEWNTIVCDDIFNRPCPFKTIHSSPSNEWPIIIRDHYRIGENVWNPALRGSYELDMKLKEEEQNNEIKHNTGTTSNTTNKEEHTEK